MLYLCHQAEELVEEASDVRANHIKVLLIKRLDEVSKANHSVDSHLQVSRVIKESIANTSARELSLTA